jgi:hypothetical protein
MEVKMNKRYVVHSSIFSIFLLTGIVFSTVKADAILLSTKGDVEINNEEVIRSTDIVRTCYSDEPTLGLYQGNGTFGCIYGSLGLHHSPLESESFSKYGKTQYMHLKHWVRAKFGADYLIPLGRIYWQEKPDEIRNYKQYQSFYDGTVSTQFTCDGTDVNVKTWFDPVAEDVAGVLVDVKGSVGSDIVFAPSGKMKIHYDQHLTQTSEIVRMPDCWKIEMSCLGRVTTIYLKTDADAQIQDSSLVIKLHSGKNEILMSVGAPINMSGERSLEQSKKWWHDKWDSSGLLILPDQDAQQMWVRSMAQLLSTCHDKMAGFPPPNGLTGNMWPFSFPQDLSYIHPVFLATGNVGIAKSWSEYFAERVSGMKNYTRRLLGVEGILCPWTFPYGDFQGYHDPGPPNKFYYEIHNSGYLARMVHETAIFVNDEKWTKQVVVPIIEETARFYKNICSKGADGLWHFSVKPSMGQDEHGGANQDDYLCTLFSAKYCFQRAIEYGLDSDGSYAAILKDGLAFESLKSSKGYYFSCGGRGLSDFGQQKHPVQLNDLAYLPVNEKVEKPSLSAYNLRYEITKDAKKPYFYGWTLGEFLLAGSRIGNVDEWTKDWGNLLKSNYVDPDWIQVYETSDVYAASFYTTTSGLIAQSLLNNLVSDWFGRLEIAKCNPWKGKIYIKNIHSKLGVKIDGQIEGDRALLELTAWKECRFELDGELIHLQKNEKITRTIRGE